MIVFLLNGCASDSTETQIESYDTQETLQVNKKEFSNRAGSDCTIKEFKLPLPENADISCFCYSSPYIYYGISYTFYKESMLTAGKEFVYSDDYATQIRRYDVQTKKIYFCINMIIVLKFQIYNLMGMLLYGKII